MHRHLLLFAQSAFCTFNTILNRIGNLTHSTLHLIHADEIVEVLQDIIDTPFLRHIASDITLFNLDRICTTTDKLGEDILRGLVGKMTVTKRLVLDLNLIFEETCQLVISLWRESGNTIFSTQIQLTDIRQFLESWCRQTEGIFETVGHSWVTLQKVIQALGQT